MPRKTPTARPARRASTSTPKTEADGATEAASSLLHEVDGLVYVLDVAPRRSGKNVVTVKLAGPTAGPPLTDRVDLFSHRSRRAFAQVVADTHGRPVDVVMGHLAFVLDSAERAAQQQQAAAQAVTGERREAAEVLLSAPDLLDRAASAMEALGHVGEEQVSSVAKRCPI